MNLSPYLPLFADLMLKSAAVAMLAWLATRCWRGASAANRHLVWLAAFGVLLALPVTTARLSRAISRAEGATTVVVLELPAKTSAPLPAAPVAEELPVPPSSALPAPPAAPTLVPPPASVPAVPVRYLTHREFAATFQPLPGNYEVMMIHPFTRRPVKVCFSLPPGRICEVDADRSELRFDYGKWELEVHFKRDGRVVLDIDD